jgi:hypothetical protein
MGKIVTYIIWKKIPYGHSPRTQVLPFSLATFPPPPSIPRRNLLPSHHGVSRQLRAQVEAGEHARAAARPHCRHWDTSLHCRVATDAPGHPPSIPRVLDSPRPRFPASLTPRHLPPLLRRQDTSLQPLRHRRRLRASALHSSAASTATGASSLSIWPRWQITILRNSNR